jgi:hypothetical protein
MFVIIINYKNFLFCSKLIGFFNTPGDDCDVLELQVGEFHRDEVCFVYPGALKTYK